MSYHVITYSAKDHLDLTNLIEGDISLNSWTPINVSMTYDSMNKKYVAAVLYSFESEVG